ncbi:UPF0158 family protein [Fictibacillus barbaricus]|uniref:Uncharacterized protein n=1 Tax=Fictibacillus barbaricus TaxID=182136 RepID=A0ABS2ZHU9_9BACL|nr:UPF0158 family protein [Fictibacillus barbaricus]MBN3546184.1 hypothetical protein [Fictibacillus barbaricus]GGB39159.1 hypothetical protein GCM10007199_00320 [Fictibacillus barbaricus]
MFIEKLMVAYMDDKANHIYYLDTAEQVILLDAIEPDGLPNLEFLDADEPERFVEIPKVLNVEAFSWMVEFESQNQNNELLHALNEDVPFERFNEKVAELNLLEEWQAFQKEKVKNRIENWLIEKKLLELQKQPD